MQTTAYTCVISNSLMTTDQLHLLLIFLLKTHSKFCNISWYFVFFYTKKDFEKSIQQDVAMQLEKSW